MKKLSCIVIVLLVFGLLGCELPLTSDPDDDKTSGTQEKVQSVAFEPRSGTYSHDIKVKLASDTNEASIYYTTDGSEPDITSKEYDGLISVAGDGAELTIKAIAVAKGHRDSDVSGAIYNIDYETASMPKFHPAEGTYAQDIEVELSSDIEEATIYYEVAKGGEQPESPTTDSSHYTGPIKVEGQGSEVIIKAITVAEGYSQSNVAEATFYIEHVDNIPPLIEDTDCQNFYYGESVYCNVAVTDNVAVDFVTINGELAEYYDNVYRIFLSDLPAGNYNYEIYAQDTSGNSVEDTLSFTVYKAEIILQLESSHGWLVNGDIDVTVNGSGCPPELEAEAVLKRNDIVVGRPDVVSGTGVYEYVYSTSGNENYRESAVTATLVIDSRFFPDISFTPVDGSNFNYNDGYQISGQTDSDGNITIYRDGEVIPNGYIENPPAGTYEYKVTVSETENFFYGEKVNTITVNKIVPTASITNTREWSFVYDGTPAEIGIFAVNPGDSDVDYRLYRNGTYVGTSDTISIPGIVFVYRVVSTEGQNYSAVMSHEEQTLFIEKMDSEVGLSFDKESPQEHGTEITVYCEKYLGDGDLVLEKNGDEVARNYGDITYSEVLPVGNFNFRCYMEETIIYKDSYVEDIFAIERPPGNIQLFLNDVEIVEDFYYVEGKEQFFDQTIHAVSSTDQFIEISVDSNVIASGVGSVSYDWGPLFNVYDITATAIENDFYGAAAVTGTLRVLRYHTYHPAPSITNFELSKEVIHPNDTDFTFSFDYYSQPGFDMANYSYELFVNDILLDSGVNNNHVNGSWNTGDELRLELYVCDDGNNIEPWCTASALATMVID